MSFEWDPRKAAANQRKHRVPFAEATAVFWDELALTIRDDESDPHEERFLTLGAGIKGRVLVVAYTYRGDRIRIISARPATRAEREQYEANRR